MNTHNEKPFKQLWSELRKAGWNSRKPMGLSNNNTYIKPVHSIVLIDTINSVNLGEQELMSFGRQAGLLELPPLPSLPQHTTSVPTRPPIGNAAAYELAHRQMPRSPPSSPLAPDLAPSSPAHTSHAAPILPPVSNQCGSPLVAAGTVPVPSSEDRHSSQDDTEHETPDDNANQDILVTRK
ncbi:hypothetical protein PI126_g12854 [Phytophthora idaei]|nr:hypothetical protein PI126_g12854 [Phytophthora idaei]